MPGWPSVQDGVHRFVLWSKGSVVLTTAAKVALQAIPVVGQALSDLYDEAGQGAEQEESFRLLQEILVRVDDLGELRFEDSAQLIEVAVRTGSANGMGLLLVRDSLRDLQDQVRSMRAEMQTMVHVLEHLEGELFGLAWGAADFDPHSEADHVTLLVLLQASLRQSLQILRQQGRMACSIIKRCEPSAPVPFAGVDDQLWWLSRRGEIPTSERSLFRELRRITDRMRQVNLRIRTLIRQNDSVRLPQSSIQTLDEHLSTWLANTWCWCSSVFRPRTSASPV